MNEIQKYNYDVVIITEQQIQEYGGVYLKPNESMTVHVTDEFKQEIGKMENKNEIVKRMFFFPDMGIPLGFNYEGFDKGRGMHITRVFYHNPDRAFFEKLLNKK